MQLAPDLLNRLTALGLNELEAHVYVFLLGNRPMTAYAVARQIGKATANTYKAIESLARRGAVLIEDGDNRQCRAVPVREFLAQLERTFHERTTAAAEALTALQVESHDERVYKLESVPQLFERCRQMLAERAERIVMVDAFPRTLQRIAQDLRAAAARGVSIHVLAYRPVKIPGTHISVAPRGEEAESFWNSQQLNIVVDGRETLIALLNTELTQIHQALWSNSLYLSCLMHAGIRSEHTLHRLYDAQSSAAPPQRIAKILGEHKFFLNSDVPGQKELLARFVNPGATP
jgi:sugar-specific transcriptional regulator TrmB